MAYMILFLTVKLKRPDYVDFIPPQGCQGTLRRDQEALIQGANGINRESDVSV